MTDRKKISITGYTSSIGKMLYEHLKIQHDCLLFSRTNGYDFFDEKKFNTMIGHALTSDCFINLAHVHDIQSKILINLKNEWKHSDKLKKVITFGTIATKINPEILKEINVDQEYLKQKKHLDAVHNGLSLQQPFGQQIKFTMLRIANYGKKHGNRECEPTCLDKDITDIVDYTINSDLYISNIDLRRI